MKGFIDTEQQERLYSQALELNDDLESRVFIQSDRAFIERILRTVTERDLTVAEADRLASIYGTYSAHKRKMERKHKQ